MAAKARESIVNERYVLASSITSLDVNKWFSIMRKLFLLNPIVAIKKVDLRTIKSLEYGCLEKKI